MKKQSQTARTSSALSKPSCPTRRRSSPKAAAKRGAALKGTAAKQRKRPASFVRPSIDLGEKTTDGTVHKFIRTAERTLDALSECRLIRISLASDHVKEAAYQRMELLEAWLHEYRNALFASK